MKEYRQCYQCQWNYLQFYQNISLERVGEYYYCPLCNPMENKELENRIINDNRKELAKHIFMLQENPTTEQLEAEILRERESVLQMSTEELEAHIDGLDKLYKELQLTCKKVKVKSIAALELRRSRGPKAKEKKAKSNDIDNTLNAMLKKIQESKGLGSFLKVDNLE